MLLTFQKLLRSNQHLRDQSNSLDPSGWEGGVTGGQKGWMGLVGRLRAARTLHAGRKTRPLRRESERRTGNEDSEQPREKEKKKNSCHLLSSRGDTRMNSTGKTGQDTKRSSLFSLSDMLPASTTNCSSRSLKWKHSGHRAASAGRVTCPGLATLVPIWFMASWFATHFTSISPFIVTVTNDSAITFKVQCFVYGVLKCYITILEHKSNGNQWGFHNTRILGCVVF